MFTYYLIGSVVVEKGITVYSDVDKKNIGIDEQVTLRLTIAGSGFFPDPKLPEIKEFSVIKTRQFTGIDFTKGVPTPYTVFEYIFTPYQKGILTIPKIFVNYKGYYYSSQLYKIAVGDKLRDVQEDTIPFEESRQIQEAKGDAIFIKSNISSNNIFYNQQIEYTYTIFTRVPIKKIPTVEIPEFEAFHLEPLYYRKEYTTNINDTRYRAFEFKFSLFPFMTDTQKIPALKMICSSDCFPADVIRNTEIGRYLKGSGYFSKDSQSFNVAVLPLPLRDKPLSFSGLIGEFEITSEVDKKEIGIEDSLVLTVKVKGSGNVRSIPTIKCPLMDNLREYNSDSFMNYDKKETKIIGEKLFRFVLIPRDLGKDTVPSIGFSYFDEKKQQYLTKWSDSIEINIVKKTKESPDNKNGNTKNNKKYYFIGIGILLLGALFLIFRKIKKV
jgi:hypothetical protein